MANIRSDPITTDHPLGHVDERVAVIIGSDDETQGTLRHAIEEARRRRAPLEIIQVLDEHDPLVAAARSHAERVDPVLHQFAVWVRLHDLAESAGTDLEGVDHDLHVVGQLDDRGRVRLLDLLQEVTLTIIGDDSPLLHGTTPEQLALALAEAARCGVVVVPHGHDGTRAA